MANSSSRIPPKTTTMAATARRRALLLVAAIAASVAEAADTMLIGKTCSPPSDGCGPGLHCSSCSTGSGPATCTRAMPIDPKTHEMGLPFNKYSWLTTHNSFALVGVVSATGAGIIAPINQEDTITAQLKNGVRGLMLDTYDFQNDVWLCHSFNGQCYNFTGFQPAINVFKEIGAFLDANPSEVITIFLEDYTAAGSLPRVFNASGLAKYWFPVAKMPKNGSDWPLLKDMISLNQRLVVFTSKQGKEASEGIAFEWNYVVENQYGSDGMVAGTCPNRAESPPMNSTAQSLVLMNFFSTSPGRVGACTNNSAPLLDMLKTCYELSAKRWPNFVAVDFYMRSDGGGAPLATDVANGHLVCGCDNIAYCQANAPSGTCVVPPPSPPSSSPEASGTDGASDATDRFVSCQWSFFLGLTSLLVMLLS